MRTQQYQRNSLIGPVEAKTGKCGPADSPSHQNQGKNPFGGPIRRLAGTLALVVAGVMAVNDRQGANSADGLHTFTGQPMVQKADIIDDIIEIIEEIINPPVPPCP